jgi:hypothetical protein
LAGHIPIGTRLGGFGGLLALSWLRSEQTAPEALTSLGLQLLLEAISLLFSPPVLGLKLAALLLELLGFLLGLQTLGAFPLHFLHPLSALAL